MQNNQSSYDTWTWVVAFLITLVLFWMFISGRVNSESCCVSDEPTTEASAPPILDTQPEPTTVREEAFSFDANEYAFNSSGDQSKIEWASKTDELKARLQGGISATGDKNMVTITGTVVSEELKQETGLSIQEFFGPDITIDNQLLVVAPEAIIEEPATALVSPPDAAKVYFNSGVYTLPDNVNLTLDPIVSWLNNTPDSKAIISGFHDPTGDLAFNQQLAKQRAESIYNALINQGIAAERLVMRKPESTEGDGNLDEARRVEVSVE